MIIEIDGRFINLSHVREVSFDGEATTFPEPAAAPDQSYFRICTHEAAHALVSHLLGRVLIEVTVDTDAKYLNGFVQSLKHEGDESADQLAIIAAGRVGEELALGDVHEGGCSGDDESAAALADKLSGGNSDRAAELIREARAVARGLLKPHTRAIHKLAFRLALKKTLILDLAAKEIEAVLEECKMDARSESVATVPPHREARERMQSSHSQRAPSGNLVFTAENCPVGMRSMFETVWYRGGTIL